MQAQPAVAAVHYVLLLGLTAAVLARNARAAPPAPTRPAYEFAELDFPDGALCVPYCPPGGLRPKSRPKPRPKSSPKPRKRKAA